VNKLPLSQLQAKLQQNKISLSEAILEALPILRKTESDTTLSWLANELQGYHDSMSFYTKPDHSLPAYRVVQGSLKLLGNEGQLLPLDHALANRKQYFIGAPVGWVEDFASLPGNECVAELPDLANIGQAGQVVIQLPKGQLQRILNEVKARLLLLVEQSASNSAGKI
jgi:beta-glucosidase-like glycosyl hydrolase